MIEIGLNHGRFEPVHDHLAPPSKSLVIDPGEEGVDDPEKVRKELLVQAKSRQMRVIGHEAVGIDGYLIPVFVFEEQVVIEPLGPIGFQQPVSVMALPGDVECGSIG